VAARGLELRRQRALHRPLRRLRPPRNTPRRIAGWTVFDLHAGWSGARDELSLGIVNLADRDPPFRDASLGYDSFVHDPLGRQWWLSWRHRF
jgi:outer membrane receptor protein involved in Fe transport